MILAPEGVPATDRSRSCVCDICVHDIKKSQALLVVLLKWKMIFHTLRFHDMRGQFLVYAPQQAIALATHFIRLHIWASKCTIHREVIIFTEAEALLLAAADTNRCSR